MLVVASAVLAASCFQPQVVSDPAAGKAETLRVLQAEPTDTADLSAPGIQVLPAGDVTDRTVAALAPTDIVPTTVTHWAKTTRPSRPYW